MLIDGLPQRVLLAVDGEKDLVQVPRVATVRAKAALFLGRRLTELQAALSDRFVGPCDAWLGHTFFHVAGTG